MTKIISFEYPVQKSASDQNPVEVGDTVTLNVIGDDGATEPVDVELTYVGFDGREIGWDSSELSDKCSVHSTHSKHSLLCASN